VLAVEIYLDGESEQRVRSLWSALDARGIDSLAATPETEYRPHVSLAVFTDVDASALRLALTPLLKPCIAMPLTLASLGFFPGSESVAFLGVTPTATLLETHRQVHAAFTRVATESWPIYEPGNFVPHCTLAVGFAETGPIHDAIQSRDLPIASVANEVHLVEITSGRSRARLA
jgi:2'-5' RNA ligase